jgi:8-oxo-dGTP pyrophosphatase MutT (NUDIX family)
VKILFLDDDPARVPQLPEDAELHYVRSWQQFTQWLTANGTPDVISYDYDLTPSRHPKAKGKDNGADCARWAIGRGFIAKTTYVHSWNWTGAERIRSLHAKADTQIVTRRFTSDQPYLRALETKVLFHGTVSTFDKSIREHGLRKKRGGIWNRLAKRSYGMNLEFPSGVWCSDSYEYALGYARLGADIMHTEYGEEVWRGRGIEAAIRLNPHLKATACFTKLAHVYDDNAEPIVFAFEIDESELIPHPTKSHEFLLRRAIRPEELVPLKREMYVHEDKKSREEWTWMMDCVDRGFISRPSHLTLKVRAEMQSLKDACVRVGKVASGILPVARDTKRLCLAWRSSHVQDGDCWSTIGGTVKQGLTPMESAKAEMKEEVGYAGGVELHPGHIFEGGNFRYENFIGLVDHEFELNPAPGHAWETDAIEWRTLEEIENDIKQHPTDYHPGLISFFKKSRGLIRRNVA